MNRVLICDSLLRRNETEPFLKKLITGDEKWITYDKNVRKRSCQNKLVRKRCTGCYAKLKAQGAQEIRAKQVHTQCKQCQKAFCLDCFNQKHVD
ncbi:hypothetical protein K1T71_008109 [Dendrolimus kikuchii]|uniref:Uncharacterized protein n=1 Tax=Dendrolimus kikuchii TaxID=765133 RepID=A0ACC1CWB2_9NEOP|nr:hypothetical protein K1T71_008109 [Dendrolimus kikuchii]